MRCGHSWSKVQVVGLGLLAFSMVGCGDGKQPNGSMGGSGGTGAATKSGTDVVACPGAVAPSLETIEKNEYKPLSRPLFIYVNKKALQKPEVAAYVKLMLGDAQKEVVEAGFIKLKEDLLKQQQDKLNVLIKDVKIPDKLMSGTVAVNGSSTVFPYAARVAELLEQSNDGKVSVPVAKKGTGGGFELFCRGETDINNASRTIKQEEKDQCAKSSVEYEEFTVCIDGISVCVNPKNTFCSCLTVEQLKAIWEPDSKIKTWKDVNPDWPDKKIELYGPDTDSGTFEYFTEVIVGKAKSSRTDYTSSSDDNVLVTGISGDDYSLGYFGFSYYDHNRDSMRALAIKPAEKKTEKK